MSLLPVAGMLTDLAALPAAATTTGWRFFSAHQAAVIDAATRRLVPGPEDDPEEIGHPGAAEAQVVRFLDTMLAAFTFAVPKVHAGGPWSNRHAPGPDYLTRFVPLDPAQVYSWTRRIKQLQRAYIAGVKELDQAAGGDFTSVNHEQQDQILERAQFTAQLFTDTISAMYSVPEYGGNAGLVGWKDARYPGDVQPVGYTDSEVTNSDGPDPVDPTGVVGLVIQHFPVAAQAMAGRKGRRG